MDRFFFALWRGTFFSLSLSTACHGGRELCKRGESSHPLSVFVFLNEPMSPCLGLTACPVGPFPGNIA